MPRPRIAMRKIREVLRLTFGEGLSRRQVSAVARHPGHHRLRPPGAGQGWPGSAGRCPTTSTTPPSRRRCSRRRPRRPCAGRCPTGATSTPSCASKGVTLQLLWLEYREAHPDGSATASSATSTCAWRKKVDVVMRQHHRAGEKLFVDFPGMTHPHLRPPQRGASPSRPSCSWPCSGPRATSTPRRFAPRSSSTG